MDIRVVIVAEHASAQFGGEAVLPLHYFRVLHQREIECWLVVHGRTRDELERLFPQNKRIHYVPDSCFAIFLFKMGSWLPARVAYFSTGFLMRSMTQIKQRKIIRRLVREDGVNIVHQPTPVSPKEPSLIFGLGVPVVIGPMNGGMCYPPEFAQERQNFFTNCFIQTGRTLSGIANRLFPGKRRAALLLVANDRTRKALPPGSSPSIARLVENGVDLSTWIAAEKDSTQPAKPFTKFVFVGRLVDWKAIDLLLKAFAQAAAEAPISLTIIGDGPEREALERSANELNLSSRRNGQAGKISFTGWLTQVECVQQLRSSDVFVLPSLLECGGAVVLEAMCMKIPVIATNWGGPADYLDDSCGLLVDPSSREALVDGLANSMVRLARAPELRGILGAAGREKVVRHFDWEAKVDRIVKIYKDLLAGHESSRSQPS